MKARIIQLSIEEPRGQAYRPQDPTYFSALVSMTLGPGDGDDGDIFYATVCSSLWFAENVLASARLHPTREDVEHGPAFGRNHLFADIFDEEAIRAAITQWVASQTAVRCSPTLDRRMLKFSGGRAGTICSFDYYTAH